MANIQQGKKYIKLCRQHRVPIFFWGIKGVGKSQMVQQVAEELGISYFDMRLALRESSDLLGLPHPDFGNNVTKILPPNELPRSGSGIFHLDEFNRSRPDMLQAAFQLVWDNRINEYILPQGWSIVACGNPPDLDEYQLTFLESALIDRFLHIKLIPDKDEVLEYFRKKVKANSAVLEFLHFHFEMLVGSSFDLPRKSGSFRTAEILSSMLPTMKALNFSKEEIEEVCIGWFGLEGGIAFLKILESAEKPIQAKDIIANFNNCKDIILEQMEKKKNHLLAYTVDDLKNYITEHQNLNNLEKENIFSFLMIIDPDLGFSIMKDLVLSKKVTNEKLRSFLTSKQESLLVRYAQYLDINYK